MKYLVQLILKKFLIFHYNNENPFNIKYIPSIKNNTIKPLI